MPFGSGVPAIDTAETCRRGASDGVLDVSVLGAESFTLQQFVESFGFGGVQGLKLLSFLFKEVLSLFFCLFFAWFH